MKFSDVWVEKYKPQKIEDVLLDQDNKDYFLSLKDISNNMLFVGVSGIGKSTVAKILANKFSPNSYLFINASEQGNIDTVRTLISDFIATASFDDNQKIVILDEADGVSLVAQQALRGVMEENLQYVKFILTANSKNKLIDALKSRCQEFSLKCSEVNILRRLIQIIQKEKIEFTKGDVPQLQELVKRYYPDIRKTINELQKVCISGKFVMPSLASNSFVETLKKRINDGEDVFEIRKWVIECSEKFNNNYHDLMQGLFTEFAKDKGVAQCLIVGEFMYRHSMVIDPEINFATMLLQLKTK